MPLPSLLCAAKQEGVGSDWALGSFEKKQMQPTEGKQDGTVR